MDSSRLPLKETILAALWFCSMTMTLACSGPPLDPVAERLFQDVRTSLQAADKNAIAGRTGFVLSGNKAQPFAQHKEGLDYPFAALVLPTDMNADGQEEIFIVFGNTYTSGMAGSSVALFIKDADGVYVQQLGFPGVTPDALSTTSLGYPDLLIGGPGFEYPVWRWDGNAYGYDRIVADADYSKLEKRSVEELSRAHQGTIKK